MSRQFLGVDQSLTHTGVCILTEDKQLISLHTIQPPAALRGVKRLAFIRDRIRGLLSPRIIGIAFEDYAYDKPLQAHQLGEIGGTLKLLVDELDFPFISVSPPALKKFATGDSTATKEAMMHAAPAASEDDHQADAYHLASVARMFFTRESSTRRAQLEVIQALRQGKKKVRKRRVRKLVPSAV